MAYLAIHAVLVWLVLGVMLSQVQHVPFMCGVPVAMFEGILLFLLIDGLEHRLRRKQINPDRMV
jgi:hypothetical protein